MVAVARGATAMSARVSRREEEERDFVKNGFSRRGCFLKGTYDDG